LTATTTGRARLGPRDGLGLSARFWASSVHFYWAALARNPGNTGGSSPAQHVDVMSRAIAKSRQGRQRPERSMGNAAFAAQEATSIAGIRSPARRGGVHPPAKRARLPSPSTISLSPRSPPSPPGGEGERDGEKRWDRTRRPRNGPSRSSARPTSNGSPSLTTVRPATPLSNSPTILQMVGAEFLSYGIPRWGRPPDGVRCAQVLRHVEPLQDRAEAGGLPKKN
jgi:hypothetical protein